jgi:DNA-binding GntR family transcriptional regulator
MDDRMLSERKRTSEEGGWPSTAGTTPLASTGGGHGAAPFGPERTMEQLLVREMRQLIVEGTLAPGQRLRYRDMADQFGVSITPVRIALRELAKEGLVETRAHEGARVSRLSAEALEELFATRIGIEAWLARYGAPRMTNEDLKAAAEKLVAAERAVLERDRESLLEVAWACRCDCYRAAGRQRLYEAAQTLFERSARYHRLTLSATMRLDETLEFLRRFERACRAGDGRDAANVVINTLERAAEYMLEQDWVDVAAQTK